MATEVQITNKKIDTGDIRYLTINGDNIDTVNFHFPRFYNGKDLSLGTTQLLYKRPDGTGDADLLTVTTTETEIIASWDIRPNFTCLTGKAYITVRVVLESNLWQSFTAPVIIERSIAPTDLQCEPTVFDQYLYMFEVIRNETIQAKEDAEAAKEYAEVAITDPNLIIVAEDLALAGLSNIKIVAGDITAVQTVSDNIAHVQTVSDNMAHIVAVENDLTNINTVALNIEDVQAVGGNIGHVVAVSENEVNINAVNANKTNIDAVSENEENINAVNANKTNIDAVALNTANIDTVASNTININKVSAIDSQITTVSAIDAQIAALALITAEIINVNAISTEVTTVSENMLQILAVYAKLTEITALYGKIPEIDALYAQLDTIATKANQSEVDTIKGVGYTEGSLKAHEDRLDTLEGADTVAGSVAKTVKDAVDPIEARLDITELTLARQGQDLASVKQTLQQGNGATLDFSGIGSVVLDARATGRANPTVEGRTATNLVVNGDATTSVTSDNTGTSISILTNGTWAFNPALTFSSAYQQYQGAIGDVLFIRTKLDSSSVGRFTGRHSILYSDGSSQNDGNVAGNVLESSGLITLNSALKFIIYVSEGTAGLVERDYQMAINLTSIYGAGNEPSASDCAKIFSYFDGTKSIQLPARVRSVGKNLCYGEVYWANYLSDIPYIIPIRTVSPFKYSDSVRGVAAIAKIQPNTLIRLTIFGASISLGSYNLRYAFYSSFADTTDRTKAISSGIAADNISAVNVTTSATAKYVVLMLAAKYSDIGNGGNLSWTGFQIGLGSTATTYEPYTDSTLYIADDSEARSIQDIYDTISVINGEHMLTKKISTPISVLSGVAVNTTNYPTAKTGGKFAVELTAGGTQIGIIGTDSTTGAGTLRYELKTPITTPLLTSGILQAKQKGTVYYEPYYEGSHQTNASSQITLPYEGTIDKLTGYDENLEPYEIPSTGYTLVGTLLTITGAEENEVYYVELSRSEPLAPEMTVNTLNNDQVTLDSVNGKYYKITFTTASGVPTTVATEVV